MGGSLLIGRVAGVPIRVHWSAAIVAFYLAYNLGGATSWLVAVLGVLGFGVSILGHELGHALIARKFGVRTSEINLWALGGVARLDREANSPLAEGSIAIAGPAASAVLGATWMLCWALLPTAGLLGDLGRVAVWLGVLNIMICGFNLLPGSPLDGGRVLRAVRWSRHGDRLRAMREAGRAGIGVGAVVTGAGVMWLLAGHGTYSLILVGLFILANARDEVAVANQRERFSSVTVRDVAWLHLAEADEYCSVKSALDSRERLGGAGVLLVVSNGVATGAVVEDELLRVPEAEQEETLLVDLAHDIGEFVKVSLDDDLISTLGQMRQDLPVLLVTDGTDITGSVPLSRLTARLRDA